MSLEIKIYIIKQKGILGGALFSNVNAKLCWEKKVWMENPLGFQKETTNEEPTELHSYIFRVYTCTFNYVLKSGKL